MASVWPMGARSGDISDHDQRLVADWIWDALAPTYGPDAGTKLILHDDLQVMESGASALREMPLQNYLTTCYQDLAANVQASGDGATTAVLLAARMVREVLACGTRQGLELAKRQALVQLRGMRIACEPLEALGDNWPWSETLLPHLLERQDVNLHDVTIEFGDLGWRPGIEIRGKSLHHNSVRGALVLDAWQQSRHNISLRMQLDQSEERPWRLWRDWGVQLLLCRQDIPLYVQEELHTHGMVTATIDEATWKLVQSVAIANQTHAHPTAVVPLEASFDQQWRLELGQTLRLPALNDAMQQNTRDAGERWLRTVGTVLLEPGQLPANWRVQLAKNLRGVSDHAEGRVPLLFRAVAAAFEAVHDSLQRRCPDAYGTMRIAVASAFDCAAQLLRLDGVHTKMASRGSALRGGEGPMGSPKNMPGDIPPLM